MPWTQTEAVLERQKFVKAVLSGRSTMTDVCQRFGVSRQTGYEVMARHRERGMVGLVDASRAPKTHPNQSSPEVEGAVLRVRKAHPTWGSKKIIDITPRHRSIMWDQCTVST
jgi:transposase